MPAAAESSRDFTGPRPMFAPCLNDTGVSMLDLAFVILGAVLFLGALVYARACAQL